jgi:hypothetical protein
LDENTSAADKHIIGFTHPACAAIRDIRPVEHNVTSAKDGDAAAQTVRL